MRAIQIQDSRKHSPLPLTCRHCHSEGFTVVLSSVLKSRGLGKNVVKRTFSNNALVSRKKSNQQLIRSDDHGNLSRRTNWSCHKIMSDSKGLHAHWDCSNGITGIAILAASLGVAKDAAQQKKWIEDIQTSATAAFYKATGQRVVLTIDRCDDDTLTIECQGKLSDAPMWTWGKVLDVLGGLLPSGLYSPWASETANAVLVELIGAERKLATEEPLKTDTIFLDFIVKIVWSIQCLDLLNVRTGSYTSLPLNLDGQTPLIRQLLLGMNVSLETPSSNTTVMDEMSLALLRVLTGVSSLRPGIFSPRQMKLHTTGRGIARPFVAPHTIVHLYIGKMPTKNATESLQLQVSDTSWTTNRMTLLEANIDDTTAEHLAFCVEELLLAGAADAWVAPIVMKKGRAAHTLHCLCHTRQTDALLSVIFRNSTTIGVRTQPIDRVALRRIMLTVQTEWVNTKREGRVDVKVGYLGEDVMSVKAEFDHCKEICREAGVTIQSVSDQAVQRARTMLLDDIAS